MDKRPPTHGGDALITIQLDAPLTAAIELMTDRNIRHLPVLDGSQLVGIVSDRDLAAIETLMQGELGTVKVAEAMTPEPYVVSETLPLADVAKTMAEHKYGCVLVTNEEGALTAIFTANDALLLLADAASGRSIGDAISHCKRLV